MRDKHDKSAVEVKACLYIAAAAFPRHKTPIFEGNELSFIILPFEGSFKKQKKTAFVTLSIRLETLT